VIQQKEVTKQLEHGTRQAAYEMQARQYEISRVKDEGDEARRTLIAQTDHANRQAKYADGLERQRFAAQLGAQRDAREAELRRLEESALRQEELKRKTLRYEAELRSKTELKRAEAEAQARAQSERENHDLSLERMRAEMKERRETLLQSISVGFSSLGDGAKMFLGNQQQMGNAVVLASTLALGVYGARMGATVVGNYVAAQLGKPSLVRETSRTSPLVVATQPMATARKLLKPKMVVDALDRVILEEGLELRLRRVATSTKYTKANGAPFRHVLLHGPPGTGKTMFAKKLAAHSGLDYAILTGGDIAPLGREAVTEIHKLFDWATLSRNGLLLFIDEADAFLRKRASEAISEDLRNAFNAFLYRTGEPSHDFMLVYASNAPEEFDWAINDRIDEIVEFTIPSATERERMLAQYVNEYLNSGGGSGSIRILVDGVAETHLKAAVAATEGFSGREIHKLVVAWQAAAFGSEGAVFTPSTMQEVLDSHVAQRELKENWNTNE
jgi:ATPase family AAA domain-containing protein 3A/B